MVNKLQIRRANRDAQVHLPVNADRWSVGEYTNSVQFKIKLKFLRIKVYFMQGNKMTASHTSDCWFSFVVSTLTLRIQKHVPLQMYGEFVLY